MYGEFHEEFLIQLIDDRIFEGLPDFDLDIGPQTAFMSLAFTPADLNALGGKPPVEVKEKYTDFALGKTGYFKFSPDPGFDVGMTSQGKLVLAVLAAECKVNQSPGTRLFRLNGGSSCPSAVSSAAASASSSQ